MFKNKFSWETNRFCPWYKIYQFYKRKGFRIPENYTEMHDYNRKYRLNLAGNDEIWLRINFKFTIIRWWDGEGHRFDDFSDNNLCLRNGTTKNQKRNYRRSEKGSISNVRTEFHWIIFLFEKSRVAPGHLAVHGSLGGTANLSIERAFRVTLMGLFVTVFLWYRFGAKCLIFNFVLILDFQ